jgi:signal transduction histidine kinase
LKFSEDGSEIEVRVHHVGDGVEFKVIDHGMGIRPDFLPFIFDRFRQDVPPRTLSSGLGLGLPIVRAITEIHGGEVKALSEGQGKGSVFTIFLPLGSQAA